MLSVSFVFLWALYYYYYSNLALFASSYLLFEKIFTAPCSFSIPSFIIFIHLYSGRQLVFFLFICSHFFLFIFENGGSRFSPLYISFEPTVRHSFHVCYRYISMSFCLCSMFVRFLLFHCYSVFAMQCSQSIYWIYRKIFRVLLINFNAIDMNDSKRHIQ